MRRRRKKLSNVIYTMDRRLRSVELKKTVFNRAGLSASVDDSVDPITPPGTVYQGNTPNLWHRITGAYYYPASVIGDSDRAEIFLDDSDTAGLSAERGELMSISRLEYAARSVSISSIGSSTTIRAHGTPNWALTTTNTRQSKKFNGNQVYLPLADTGSGFAHTYLFSPGISSSSFPIDPLRYELSFNAAVSKHSATTTTATITFSSGHHYEVDDVIEVKDLPAGYQGIDGIFKVKAITSTTLTYDFSTPLTAAITEANAAAGVYVYSVAQKAVDVGSTYIDSTDGTVYYWDGIRYVNSAPAGLSNDGIAPSPPTNLVLTTAGYSIANNFGGLPRSRVDLTWTAPTTSQGGGALDDLAGYRIFISETGYSDWTQKITYEKAVTSQTITNLDQNKEYYFRVIAFDSFGLDSTGLDDSIVTGVAALTVTTPSAPIIPDPRLGVVTVKWDGKDNTGAVIPSRLLDFIEVHASATSGFTPSDSTLVGKIFSASDICSVTDLTYNVTYYFKFIAKDKVGNSTTASVQTSAVVRPLVDADLIASQVNSPLSTWPFANAVVTPGALAANTINASNLFGENVIIQSAIAANAIGANQIAAGAITAGKIAANAIVAANIQALQISADKIEANAITADKINAGAITAVKIAANTITTDKLVAGTLTGFTVNTATSGTRVSMNLSEIVFYNASNISAILGTSASAFGISGFGGSFALNNGLSISGNSVSLFLGNSSGSGILNINASQTDLGGTFRRTALNGGGTTFAVISNAGDFIRGAATSSDRRLKENISTTNLGLDFIKLINPVEFEFVKKDNPFNPGIQFGIIAQELLQALNSSGINGDNGLVFIPEIPESEGGSDGYYKVNHEQLISPLIKAIQELSAKVEALEERQ
jgi:hypothetical protein